MDDYKHPIILQMKKYYREGLDALECARHTQRHGIMLKEGELLDLFENALQKLNLADSEIPKLIEQMRGVTDLPKDDRDYYVPFMESHHQNIVGWLEEAQNSVSGLNKKIQ